MRTGSAKDVDAQSTEAARETVIQLVARIQKADYEGDRSALGRLYAQLAPFEGGKELAPRVRYWRGFAMWRRTINGFNDSVDPKELEQDLKEALDEFGKITAAEPGFGDARIGMVSCLGSLIFIHQKDVPRVEELARQIGPLAKEAKMVAPDNPRLFWVAGPNIFITPPERGGGQDKAIEMYERGLAAARKHKGEVSDPLEPSWGEPELLMSLAWSHLNRSKPDLKAAEQNARAALEIVPYWHYVRDILIPQIRDAAAKKSQRSFFKRNPHAHEEDQPGRVGSRCNRGGRSSNRCQRLLPDAVVFRPMVRAGYRVSFLYFS